MFTVVWITIRKQFCYAKWALSFFFGWINFLSLIFQSEPYKCSKKLKFFEMFCNRTVWETTLGLTSICGWLTERFFKYPGNRTSLILEHTIFLFPLLSHYSWSTFSWKSLLIVLLSFNPLKLCVNDSLKFDRRKSWA